MKKIIFILVCVLALGMFTACGSTSPVFKGKVMFDEKPLAGVRVSAGGESSVTAADGAFTLSLKKGEYQLSLEKDGYMSEKTVIDIVEDYHYAQLNMYEKGSLRITTLSTTGVPLAAKVSASGYTAVATAGISTLEVPVKDQKLTVTGTGIVGTEIVVKAADFGANKTQNIELSLLQLGTVDGTVTDKYGEVMSDVSVTLGSQSTLTDENGEYKFTGAVVGTLNLRIAAQDYLEQNRVITADDFNLDGTLTVDIILTDEPEIPLSYSAFTRTLASGSKRYTSHNTDKILDNFSSRGDVRTHTEGICLQVNTPATELQTYLYAKITVTSANDMLTVSARNFKNQGLEASLFVCLVFDDGSTATIVAVGETRAWYTINSETHLRPQYDLSEYDGMTVGLIIGTNAGNHCCINEIIFA